MTSSDDRGESPLFDNLDAALRFAFNSDVGVMPQPVMVKEMAAAPNQPFSKAVAAIRDDVEAEVRRSSRPKTSGQRLTGLTAAAQAGICLKHLARLDDDHQAILAARYSRRSDPCHCRQPCCRGSRTNARWQQAINQLCVILRDRAEASRVPGKKGLSTEPRMRLIWVEAYFTGKAAKLADVAAVTETTPTTAAKHRDLIWAYLDAAESRAWEEAATIFEEAGIVGPCF